MDPLTHTFLGASLGRAGLDRLTPLALPTLLIGANLPDVDVVSYAVSADAALFYRRGHTHGVVAMVVLPVLLTLGVLLWDRLRQRFSRHDGPRARPGPLLLVAAVAVWSHPLLDWLNTYGVRLWMPFDGKWYYGDALFIVDPWIWLTLGGALFLGYSRSRRALVAWGCLALVTTLGVMAGTGPHPWARVVWLAGILALAGWRFRPGAASAARGRLATGLALGLVGVYAAFMVATSRQAESAVAAAARQSAALPPVEHFMVSPSPVDPLARTVILESAAWLHLGTFHWLDEPRVRFEGGAIEKRPAELAPRVLEAALGASCVRGMVNWMRFPFFAVDELPAGQRGQRVHLLDARYVRARGQGFGGDSVTVREDGVIECGEP